MHRNHPQLPSSGLSRRLSETTATKHQRQYSRTIPYRIILLSTQQTPLNTLPRPREDPSPTRNPSRDTDHIRSDLRPRRAQRRTRT